MTETPRQRLISAEVMGQNDGLSHLVCGTAPPTGIPAAEKHVPPPDTMTVGAYDFRI